MMEPVTILEILRSFDLIGQSPSRIVSSGTKSSSASASVSDANILATLEDPYEPGLLLGFGECNSDFLGNDMSVTTTVVFH